MRSLLFLTIVAVLLALVVASSVNVEVNVGGSSPSHHQHARKHHKSLAERVPAMELDEATSDNIPAVTSDGGRHSPDEKPYFEVDVDIEFNVAKLRDAPEFLAAQRDPNPKCTAISGNCATSCSGGSFHSGLCNGASSLRCCVKQGSAPTTPTTPTTPSVAGGDLIDVSKAAVNTFMAAKVKSVRGIPSASYAKHIKGIIQQFNRVHAKTPVPKAVEVLAYILATGEHESGRFTTMKEGGGERKWYAPYYGRGYVQLTHKGNYQKYNTKLHTAGLLTAAQNIVNSPNLLLQDSDAMRLCSAFVIVDGMLNGVFTGASVLRYINSRGVNYTGARAVVNGSDRASLIAGYARSWATLLSQAKAL